jgi:parallel beta-helix repeat protein
MRGKAKSISVISLILLGSLAGIFVFEPAQVSAFSTHDPILIIGNENFNSSNGVTGGNGTESDPYIIEGWEINATSKDSIIIMNTTAHFVIRNVSLFTQSSNEIHINNCTNGTITDLKAAYLYLRIRLSNSINIRIIDNYIPKAWMNIYLSYSSNNTISNNIVSNNSFDIQLIYSHNNSITENKIKPSTYGIVLTYSENNNISGNEIPGWGDVGTGVHLSFSPNNVVKNNNISKVRDGIILRQSYNITISDNQIEENFMYGIDVGTGSDDSMIDGNTVLRNRMGIVTDYAHRVEFHNNNVSYNYETGIGIKDSMFNVLENNTMRSQPWDGLYLLYATRTIVKNNKMINNDNNGIRLYDSFHNSLYKNRMEHNNNGIIMGASNNNSITYNRIRFNSDYGIALSSYSDKNHIEGNQIEKNEFGLYSEYCSLTNVSSNDFVSNNYGIYASAFKNSYIFNNQFLYNKYETVILQSFSDNNRIISNYCESDSTGFTLTSSNNNEIKGNLFDSAYWAIQLAYSENCEIKDNAMTEGGIYFVGENIQFWNSHTIDTTNTVNGNPVYYWVNKNSEQVPKNAGQVFLVGCTNVIVKDLSIERSYNAISTAFSEYNTIINNACDNNINGIYLLMSDNNEIGGNSFSKNQNDGLILDQSDSNIIYNNDCRQNSYQGISTYKAHKNIIENNTINNNDIGVELYLSNINILRNNSCNDNLDIGIYIYFSKTTEISRNQINRNNHTGIWNYYGEYNSIMHNDVSSGNGYGIISTGGGHNDIINNTIESNSGSGIYLDQTNFNKIDDNFIAWNVIGIDLKSAENNKIYHNSIMNNINQSEVAGEGQNQWNLVYPYGGNYWSDHSKIDYYQGPYQNIQGWDGISDYSYDMNGENSDQYPLMKPYGGLPTEPQELTATSGCSFIQLEWLYPEDSGSFPIINFTIYRGESPEAITFLSSVGTAEEYNDTKVENGKRYYYQVQAGQHVGVSPRTPVVHAVPGLPPSAPLDPVVTVSNDYLALIWDEPEFDGCMRITHYIIYKGFASGTLQQIAKLSNIEYFIDENVTEGTTYYYQVSAANDIGEGKRSEEVSFVIATVPLSPTNVTAIAGDRYIQLLWEPPLNDGGLPIDSYYIYRNNTDGLFEAYLKTDEDVFNFIDTEVDNGIEYGYKICARNKLGKGPLSPAVYATPEKPQATINEPPRAQISAYNTTGPPPLTVSFDGLGIDKDGSIKSYIWDFGDDNKSYERSPKHTYTQYGTYYVRLTVIDDDGASGQAMITVIVTSDDIPPDEFEEEREGSKEGTSVWFIAPIAGILICIIILMFMLFLWLKVKEEEPEGRERKRILKEPIAYRRLKRKRSVEAEEYYDQEMEE